MSDLNSPIMQSQTPPGIAGWFQTWIKAVTKPNEQTFVEISESPEAQPKTAYLWIFIVGTISGIFQAIAGAINAAFGLTAPIDFSQIPGLEQLQQQPAVAGDVASGLTALVIGICSSPITGIITVLFFALGVALVQWVAKMFGGTGSYDKLLYAYAAITVPVALVSSALATVTAIPFLGACLGIVSLGISLYALVLQVMAVKGVNRFEGWGQAIGSALLPGLVFGFLICCCLAVVFMVAMPAMGGFAP